jgi:hypothetical protein
MFLLTVGFAILLAHFLIPLNPRRAPPSTAHKCKTKRAFSSAGEDLKKLDY